MEAGTLSPCNAVNAEFLSGGKLALLVLNAKGIALFVLGLIPVFLMNKFLPPVLNSFFSKAWAQFTVQGLLIFYIILLWPIVIKLVTNKTPKTEN